MSTTCFPVDGVDQVADSGGFPVNWAQKKVIERAKITAVVGLVIRASTLPQKWNSLRKLEEVGIYLASSHVLRVKLSYTKRYRDTY